MVFARSAVWAVTVAMVGCSFAADRHPEHVRIDHGALTKVDCESASPVFDSLAAGLGAALLLGAVKGQSLSAAVIGLAVGLPMFVVTVPSAIFGYAHDASCRERVAGETIAARAQLAEDQAAAAALAASALHRANRARAIELLHAAETAGGNGDCDAITGLDDQVRALDAEFHDEVFVRSTAVRACLAASGGSAHPAP